MTTSMIVFLMLFVACAIGLYHLWHSSARQPAPVEAEPDADQLLAELFARGEIGAAEYGECLAVLRESGDA